MSSDLPSFADPPVTEVVIGARFAPLGGRLLVGLGDLLEEFPNLVEIKELDSYEAPIERFGEAASQAGGGFRLAVSAVAPSRRYWLTSIDGSDILQMQSNWLARNWRKVAPDAEYGRWDTRWEAFQIAVEGTERVIEPLSGYDQVEVTYVNHIDGRGVWLDHKEMARIFRHLKSYDPSTVLGRPDNQSFQMSFLMGGDDSTSLGRLHIDVKPAFRRPGGQPIVVLNLTARGAPRSSGLVGVKNFAELAHEHIVKAFAEITTDEMHETWQRLT